jgi:hypothetical protein
MSFWHLWMGNEGGGTATVVGSGVATMTITSSKPMVTFTGGELVGCVTKLSEMACEGSTYEVAGTIVDEDGDALTPTTLTWSLYTLEGAVVNSRSAVPLTAADTYSITLSGNDLAVLSDDNRLRRVTVEATFTSDLGTGLPLKGEAEFRIGDLVGVS